MGTSESVDELDATLIAHADLGSVRKLIQLILGAVLECDNKAAFIQKIMEMDASHQLYIMNLIEEVAAIMLNYFRLCKNIILRK